jgi:hypothetical protein
MSLASPNRRDKNVIDPTESVDFSRLGTISSCSIV